MGEKKYLFYSYSDKTYGLIKGLLMKDIYVDIIASKGSVLVNKDMAYSVNRSPMNKVVKSIEEIEYKNYDIFIISSYTNYTICEGEILELIKNAKKENIEIIYLGLDEEINKLLKSCEKGSLYDLKNIDEIETIIKRYGELNLPIYNSKVPVVYIGGLLESIDSFDISLQIKLAMEKLDYKISLITTETDGKLFGAINYPKNFMGRDESPVEQILSINRWVQAIDYVEKSDIILMDIPKGMIKYSDSFHNSFGIYTYMIAQSISPDYLILTLPPTIIAKEYIDELNKYFKNILGGKIDIFNVTNAIYDIGVGVTDIIDRPLYLPEVDIDKMILENKADNDLNLVNLNRKENIDIIVSNIIKKFS
jgi:peptide maturation system protein (TIGR04066 family)